MADPVPGSDDDRASQAILGALRRHRTELGGEAGAPVADDRVSERILGEARVRSGRISGSAAPRSSGGRSVTARDQGRPVPRWLWLAWLLALVAVAAAWRWL